MQRIITAAVVALSLFGAAACGGDVASGSSDDTVVSGSGNREHPPAGDVRVSKCEVDNAYGLNMATAKLTVTNASAEASDYLIMVEFVDESGTRVGEGVASLTALGPGKTAKTEAAGDSGGVSQLTCKVTQVERFAS